MTLTKTQCSALRGFAILGIFLHNFLHWLGPMVKENEYQFGQDRLDRMTGMLLSPSDDIVLQLFSFFGHYGVPVFLFLSGYGLVKKYEQSHAVDESAWEFIRKHFMKLFPMMLLGFAVFAMVDWTTPGRHHWTWTDIVTQLTMTINFFPDPDHHIWPGPYWFFGLMMQLYIVYRLILYRRPWTWTAAAVLICWAIQALCYDEPNGDAINQIRYNCIGGMLPFGMGLLAARSSKTFSSGLASLPMRWTILTVLSAAGVILFSQNFHLWLWAPALVVVFNVSLIKAIPERCLGPLNLLGVLSSAIFVCHPITRKIFIPISRGGEILDGLAIYIVATVVLAMIFQKLIKSIKWN